MPPNVPTEYRWLWKEPGPRMLTQALKEYGTLETPGNGSNPKIIGWAQEVGESVASLYNDDDIPWCGLFMAVVAKRSQRPIPDKPLWALSWATWGDPVKTPELGDILVFKRSGGGHVGLYVGEDTTGEAFHVLGGNQSDRVNITRILKERLYASRRAPYINVPVNIGRIFYSTKQPISTNEA